MILPQADSWHGCALPDAGFVSRQGALKAPPKAPSHTGIDARRGSGTPTYSQPGQPPLQSGYRPAAPSPPPACRTEPGLPDIPSSGNRPHSRRNGSGAAPVPGQRGLLHRASGSGFCYTGRDTFGYPGPPRLFPAQAPPKAACTGKSPPKPAVPQSGDFFFGPAFAA